MTIDRGSFAPEARVFAALFGWWIVFVLGGSLTPFMFNLLRVQESPPGGPSVPDVIANVVLFVPCGFLLTGAMVAAALVRPAAGAAVVMAISAGLSASLELLQTYVPGRTASALDILTAQAGTAAGITIWTLVGRRLTACLRRARRARERPGPLVRCLLVYAGLWSIAWLFPFDATVDPGQLARRVGEGRIALGLRADHYAGAAAALVSALPLGSLGVLGYSLPGTRRSAAAAATLSVLFVTVVWAAQIFIESRVASLTCLLGAATGAAVGAAATSALSRRMPPLDERLPARDPRVL